MKNGSEYARRLRGAFRKIGVTAAIAPADAPADPMRTLAVAILGRHDGPGAGEHALSRLFKRVLDWNELRVSTTEELAAAAGASVHHALEACHRLSLALNGIYRRENAMNLDRLRLGKVTEVRKYLDSLPGVDAYASASVLLWCIGAHAIPVHDRMLAVMRREGWVDPSAEREEVQAFLERHIKASEARRFCRAMVAYAERTGSRAAARKRPDATRRQAAAHRPKAKPRTRTVARKAGK